LIYARTGEADQAIDFEDATGRSSRGQHDPALAHYEALCRDDGRLADARARMSRSPLGAGALAGSTLPIERESTAAELGFAGPARNSLDAVSARDAALELLSALAILMVHLSRICEELVLWSSSEFGFVELDDAFATGSSLMPQKKNPDALELGKTFIALQQSGMTSTQIAEANGLTRNAVCGLIWRTKIALGHVPGTREPKPKAERKPKPPKAAKPRPDKPRVVKAPPPPPVAVPRDRPKPLGSPASIYELAHGGCRFPISDHNTRDHIFCNMPQQWQSSYCAAHHDRCFTASRAGWR
jgi:hypothetical protein